MKIVIPQNQGSIKELMGKSGWSPQFEASASNQGVISETDNPIIQLRSMDALREIAWGKADVGFVGADCIYEKPNWRVEPLCSFPFGRALIGTQIPRLEIVSSPFSPVSDLKDVRAGSIFLTERPNLTHDYLTANGFEVQIENNQDPGDFREELTRNNRVGISVILGSSPVQLEPGGNDLGVMVNESGNTVSDYNLKVIAKICDIRTVLIANPNSLRDETKREQIVSLQKDLEQSYRLLEKEYAVSTPEFANYSNNRSRL